MEVIVRKRDIYVCGAILALFGAWVAYALNDSAKMREELDALAHGHIDAWFTDPEGNAVDRSKYDYLAIVDAEKAFTLFGRGWGVVHTYYRDKGDEEFKTFKGIEYFYVRENGEWVLQDSAGCGAFEHHLRAFNEFMRLGVDVPTKVYDRALGIDFQYSMEHLNAKRAKGKGDA